MNEIRLQAIRVRQGENRTLFSFSIEGKMITEIAAVSRIKRDEALILGYQRPEIRKHVQQIKDYINSENPMIPNPVIIAFDSTVRFEPVGGEDIGYLTIPIVGDTGVKPGLVVDGQQRTAALREASRQSFKMLVSAFIAEDDADQREQFMLINATKPLPKTLLYELAPHTKGRLPADLRLKKFASLIAQKLNADGVLKGKIKTATNPDGFISDNAIMRLVNASLRDGALYRFRNPENGEGELTLILSMLGNFWSAVQKVFPEDFAKLPRYSRLLHGVGILTLGSLMDEMDHRRDESSVPPVEYFVKELQSLKPACSWSSGVWRFGTDNEGIEICRKWNQLQNVSKDIMLLCDYLVKEYRNTAP